MNLPVYEKPTITLLDVRQNIEDIMVKEDLEGIDPNIAACATFQWMTQPRVERDLMAKFDEEFANAVRCRMEQGKPQPTGAMFALTDFKHDMEDIMQEKSVNALCESISLNDVAIECIHAKLPVLTNDESLRIIRQLIVSVIVRGTKRTAGMYWEQLQELDISIEDIEQVVNYPPPKGSGLVTTR